jgi:methyl-accepting chemotaxis protein
VTGSRDLSGRFLLDGPGAYRFRFLDRRGRAVAEGPAIPIAVEPDAFPEVRITAPAQEVEVDAGARVRVEWWASDDFGLGELVLVTKPPASEERRQPLRSFGGARRDSGAFDLETAALGVGEGDRLLYWLEVLDGDVVSGPKRSASATQVVRIYSEAEHRRELLERARAAWEEMVGVLADRLELFAGEPPVAGEGLTRADALDQRTKALHEGMRKLAEEIRRERAAPRDLAAGLSNVAATVRVAEQRATAGRQALLRAARLRARPDPQIVRQSRAFDAQLDEALEKGILYLEQLMDKRRAEDLVRLARDLAGSRRDLAGLLEKYREAPSDEARREILARIARMKERMRDLAARMSELARGFQDEHMNAEALAEMSRSEDVLGGLDEIESLLARGDVEGALRELDELAGSMERMLAGLERTAGLPDEKAAELMREMLAFKRELEDVQEAQRQVAGRTEAIRDEVRRHARERIRQARDTLERLERLATEAKGDVAAARPGVAARTEGDFEAAHRGLEDVERALGARDLDAALESVGRALPPLQRMALALEEDVTMAERYGEVVKRDRAVLREARRHALEAVPKATEIRDELSRLFPDPRQVLGDRERRRLAELERQQGALERRAGELQQGLSRLMREAPVFPPSAAGTLSESRGHMGQAAEALGRGNPQRGAGEQALALDALERFRKGLEEAARRSGGGGGGGFPFPFAEQGGPGGPEGDGFDPARERVEIPGAEAYKVPEEFRRDLLEAMRQGTPEKYRAEVQRYYEELVK